MPGGVFQYKGEVSVPTGIRYGLVVLNYVLFCDSRSGSPEGVPVSTVVGRRARPWVIVRPAQHMIPDWE